jgi:mannose-6-phosphate isomerase-like protein (cupin superfamily)
MAATRPRTPYTGGMKTYTYPHTIVNGAGGERLTFLRRVPGTTGDRLEVENVVKPGAGPVMHVHHHQEEALTVVQGRIGYQRPGEPAEFAGPGETVVFRAGEAHKFWNAGEEDLWGRGYIEPADNLEYFLGGLFESQRRSGGSRPNLFDAAFLARRYRSEFGLVEVPAPVQRFVFPVLVAIGRLLGRYEKYADAPEPVRR